VNVVAPGESGAGTPVLDRESADSVCGNPGEFILLPAVGLDAAGGPAEGLLNRIHWMREKDGHRLLAVEEKHKIGDEEWLRPANSIDDAQIEIIDSVFATGPKLVRVSPGLRRRLRIEQTPLRLLPNCHYRTVSMHPMPAPNPIPSSGTATLDIHVTDASTGQPVAGAFVELYEDAQHCIGDRGTTDSAGQITLRTGRLPVQVDRLYVTPPLTGYWGKYAEDFTITCVPHVVRLAPVAAGHVDAARHVYQPNGQSGAGVRIGVVDHGIDAAVVPVQGGRKFVTGELDDGHGDDGTGHGTHVAGIIANSQPEGPEGIAQAATIFSYRVFGADGSVSTFSLANAVRAATDDDCHLINLSIGGLAYDEVIRDTDVWATDHGAVLLAAAGNDWGGDVTLPAALSGTLAVAASGRIGTFPAGSLEDGAIGPRSAVDEDDFFAAFANYLPANAIELIAPGVGILSVQPGGGCGPRSGTSQACAVATAAAARALTNASWLTDPSDRARTTAIKNHLLSSAQTLGFHPDFEGFGLLP
jgi:subtilisin